MKRTNFSKDFYAYIYIDLYICRVIMIFHQKMIKVNGDIFKEVLILPPNFRR